MLVSIPIVTAKEYPKEGGPYKIILQAKCFGNGGSGPDKLIHFGPFWYLDDASISFHGFLGATCFISNDTTSEICELNLTTNLDLYGFKGYAPGFGIWLVKALIPLAKIRIIGTCSEILVYPDE
jgi:hypothetical protein